MLKKNDIINLTADGMSFAGLGVAHYTTDGLSRFAVFVHNAVEGDEISCRIIRVEKNYAFGIIEKLIKPSPLRIEPECSVFDRCGGCVYLNADYGAELRFKHRLIEDAYRREHIEFPEIPPVKPSQEIRNYRNKVVYQLSPEGKFGFYARGSHRCIENANCPLQYAEFTPVLKAAEKFISDYGINSYDERSGKGVFKSLFLRRSESTGEICVCAVINSEMLPFSEKFAEIMTDVPGVSGVYLNTDKKPDDEAPGGEFKLLKGREKLTERLCGLDFRISPAAFFQINRAQTENLYRCAVEAAGITEKDTVLDLYCGIGTITLIAASQSRAKKLIGIEIIPEAIADAKENARLNGIENVSFYCADASGAAALVRESGSDMPSVVIVDPPRKGMGRDTVGAVASLNPQKLVYISCNPLTQAQDIKLLASAGYALQSVTLFDMFPRTQHVETVVLMSRVKD